MRPASCWSIECVKKWRRWYEERFPYDGKRKYRCFHCDAPTSLDPYSGGGVAYCSKLECIEASIELKNDPAVDLSRPIE